MTIKHVSVSDARTNFSELIGRAQYGDEPTVISFHDKPVAVLVPYESFGDTDWTKVTLASIEASIAAAKASREALSRSIGLTLERSETTAMALLNELNEAGVISQQQMAEQAQEPEAEPPAEDTAMNARGSTMITKPIITSGMINYVTEKYGQKKPDTE